MRNSFEPIPLLWKKISSFSWMSTARFARSMPSNLSGMALTLADMLLPSPFVSDAMHLPCSVFVFDGVSSLVALA